MTTLAAKGYSALDKVTPMYLWSYGNYKYEIEVKPNSRSSSLRESISEVGSVCEVLDCSYEDAIKKFKNMAINISFPALDVMGALHSATDIPESIEEVRRIRRRALRDGRAVQTDKRFDVV